MVLFIIMVAGGSGRQASLMNSPRMSMRTPAVSMALAWGLTTIASAFAPRCGLTIHVDKLITHREAHRLWTWRSSPMPERNFK